MELDDVIKAGGRPLVEGWLDMALLSALPESEDDGHEQWEFKLAAARAAVAAIAGPEASVEQRMQAVLYVVAHAAAIEQQAHANSRYLDPESRKTAQRFALQLMNAAARNLAVLERLRGGRGKAVAEEKTAGATEEEAGRRADPAAPGSPKRRRPVLRDPDGPGQAPPPSGANPPEAAMNRRMRRAAARRTRQAGRAAAE